MNPETACSAPVDPEECFWVSKEYYHEAVNFIATNISPSSSATSLSTITPTESDLTSEYTASYLH